MSDVSEVHRLNKVNIYALDIAGKFGSIKHHLRCKSENSCQQKYFNVLYLCEHPLDHYPQ